MLETGLTINLSIQSVANIAFLVALFIYIVYSAILVYHWKTYGSDLKVTSFTLMLYFASSVPLVIIAGALLMLI